MNKVCRTCQQNKSPEDFSTATSGKEGSNFRIKKRTMKSQCKTCDAKYAREFRAKNKNYRGSGKLVKYGEDRKLVSAIRQRCQDAKSRAFKFKLTYDLDVDFLLELFKQQQGKCAYSQQPLEIKSHHFGTLSLDKINPKLGYVVGNVQWICWAVNRAKSDMSHKMFLDMCRTITEKCNDYPVRE